MSEGTNTVAESKKYLRLFYHVAIYNNPYKVTSPTSRGQRTNRGISDGASTGLMWWDRAKRWIDGGSVWSCGWYRGGARLGWEMDISVGGSEKACCFGSVWSGVVEGRVERRQRVVAAAIIVTMGIAASIGKNMDDFIDMAKVNKIIRFHPPRLLKDVKTARREI